MKVTTFCSNNFFQALNLQIDSAKIGLKNKRKQFFIVPDRFSLGMEKYLMKNLETLASFDVDVLTFPRLANMVIGDFGSKKLLSKLDAVFLIQLILQQNEDKFVCFKKTVKTVSFASVIFDSIAQIKSCGITPAQLKNCVDKISNINLKQKMQDMCLVFEKYEEYLKNTYIDSSSRLNLLCESLKDSLIFENADVHFCRFDDLTNQGLNVLKHITQKAKNVTIGILTPAPLQPNADVYLTSLINGVESVCDELGIECVKVEKFDGVLPYQQQILNNLFAFSEPSTAMEVKDEIKLFSAENKANEIDFICKEILWLTKKGIRFKDINIVCCNMEGYENIIEQEFSRFGIPFWIDKNFSLSKTEIYKFVMSAIMCVKCDFLSSDVLKYIFNGLSGLSFDEKECCETVAEKYGITGSMWTKKLVNKFADENFEKFEQIKINLITPLLTFQKNINLSKNVCDFCNSVETFLVELNVENKLEEMSIMFAKQGNLKQESLCRQSFKKFFNTLQQMQNIIGQEEISFHDFVTILNAGVGAVEISPLPMSLDCVFVGQMLSSVFEPCKQCFVLGATETDLPAYLQDVGIISDYEISIMKEIPLSPTIKQLNQRTRMTTLQNLILSEKIEFIYPKNVGNDSFNSSNILDVLCKLFKFNNSHLKVVSCEDVMQDDNVFGGLIEKLCFNFATPKNMLKSLAENNNMQEKAKQIAIRFLQENKIDISPLLNSESVEKNLINAKQIFFPKGYTKVSQLESYFSCPFKHFVQYGLKLKEKEKSDIQAREVGDILHAVSEVFVKLSKNKKLNKEQIFKLSQKIFEKVISAKQFEHLMLGNQNKALMQGLKEESSRICCAIYYQNEHSKFKPEYQEAVFGDENFATIPEFKVDGEIVKLKGKVDRVDKFENYLRVVDYKTGKVSSTFKLDYLYTGEKIQLFVYLWAILKGLKGENLQPAGVFLMPLHNEWSDTKPVSGFEKYKMNGVTINSEKILKAQDDQVSFDNPKSNIINFAILSGEKHREANEFIPSQQTGNVVSVKAMNDMLNYSIKVSEQAISEILKGYINAKPFKDSCQFCEAKSFCSFNKFTTKCIRSNSFKISAEKTFKGENDGEDATTKVGN